MNRRAAGPVFALVCLGAALVGGPGTRLGLWDFRFAFTLMRWAAYGGAAASLVCLALLLTRRVGLGLGLAGLLAGAAAFAGPAAWRSSAKGFPPIHDITTDTVDPPAFKVILPLRQGAPNPAEYGGPAVAAQQKAAYPDLSTLRLPLAPQAAFERCRDAAAGLGWTIVSAEPSAGMIEATTETFWYGFKDDVVIRVRPDGPGSRVDVRSVSRVGRGDVGANAKRIRRFLRAVASGARH